MSLFGTSPPGTDRDRPKSSLFADDDDAFFTPSKGSTRGTNGTAAVPSPVRMPSSSLFADDSNGFAKPESNGDEHSPWGLPTPKKAGRSELVRNLLRESEVPESYRDGWGRLDTEGGVPSVTKLKEWVSQAVGAANGERIWDIMGLTGRGDAALTANEFWVLLALVGLAEEGDDVSLDGVDERRRNLPQPRLDGLLPAPKPDMSKPQVTEGADDAFSHSPERPPRDDSPIMSTPIRSPATQRPAFALPESDPWGSPELHQGHRHPPIPTTAHQSSTGTLPVRTTSNFTTASGSFGSSPPTSRATGQGASSASSWGNYNGAANEGFAASGLPAGFGIAGGSGGGDDDHGELGRSGFGRPRPSTQGPEEAIMVTSLSEKEGPFMFQHRNYQVTSARRNSKVIRRYSDFVWLLDCLQKRYPFRQLPLLPPKRVAINGNYMTSDDSFIEKRRRGLQRFANALVRHPVLNQEQLVIMFLTVPTELSVWRKQASITVVEEFTGKALPPGLEDSLSPNLQETFDTARSGVRRSTDLYVTLCSLLERLAKRNQGVAADYNRFARGLTALTEASADTYTVDTNDVPLLNDGLNAAAKHLSTSQALLEDEAKAWEEGALEDLKRHRDALVSLRDLFDRRDRLDKDNIPQLERRIEASEAKLQTIRAKPAGQVKPGEAEKVEDAIVKDKQSIVAQHARGVFIKECVRDELVYFQQSQYNVSRLHQDWSQERVKYAELQADNWRGLSEEVEGMPLGD
ncbi:sorting nexin-like protein mvp1 [Eremomyces bilateralis CBS 781.70]|uniref:Sorting nexin MVP1 n=1 Tax=Eremomyces bilateralis CBS 781.70 TaxID=1392243 RepID=A0A6G1GB99_9PEZI|nr:sorting nexin-like protein mvp1 [Eremomyces bilateralis CBS 781.70]KAF1815368.1 sorting nexin-like protein mvp1 [Eremomyces bilateralis CBS 781.70]